MQSSLRMSCRDWRWTSPMSRTIMARRDKNGQTEKKDSSKEAKTPNERTGVAVLRQACQKANSSKKMDLFRCELSNEMMLEKRMRLSKWSSAWSKGKRQNLQAPFERPGDNWIKNRLQICNQEIKLSTTVGCRASGLPDLIQDYLKWNLIRFETKLGKKPVTLANCDCLCSTLDLWTNISWSTIEPNFSS